MARTTERTARHAVGRDEALHRVVACGILLLTVLILALELLVGMILNPKQLQSAGDALTIGAILAAPFTFSAMGCLIVARRPRNTIGWMLCAVGLVFAAGMFLTDFPPYLYNVRHERGPILIISAILANGIWDVFAACLGVLLLLFPTGRPLSLFWSWLLRLGVAASAISFFALLTVSGRLGMVPIDNPIGFLPFSADAYIVLFMPSLLLLCLGLISVVRRFFVSRGDERQQLKWLTYSASFAVVLYFVSFAGSDPDELLVMFYGLAVSMISISIGIAILKYRLYDIDVLINRTLVYGLLTASLAGFYVGSIIVLQAVLRAITGQTSDLAIVISILAIAALFNPWRSRLQTFIDRRFYRRRYDAVRTLTAFQATLRDEVELDRLTDEIVATVHETVEPSHVAVWIKQHGLE